LTEIDKLQSKLMPMDDQNTHYQKHTGTKTQPGMYCNDTL